MTALTDSFQTRLAQGDEDLHRIQRLRYDVFVSELGADGAMVDHDQRIEADRFDPYFDHLMVEDETSGQVVGVYRLMQRDKAAQIGGFYTETEFELTPLLRSGRNLLELGRSCLHRDYRGGAAMYHLWRGLAAYVLEHDIEIMFGTASFHGTDIATLAEPLSLLHHRHLAPENLRVRSTNFEPMDVIAEDAIDRRRGMLAVPPLIKSYLRLGGFVGDGAYVDHAFNTVDVCLVMDTHKMNAAQAGHYTKGLTPGGSS